ncbi:MAG: SRPBCC domain-containing protein [Thermomicrobiales bacterium]|nr:SRPBCC domain-containing protein [Thermomicrobiales bacterium]
MPLSIDMEIDVNAPIERVWEAISTESGLRAWFNSGIRFDGVVGGHVEFGGGHDGSPYRFGGKILTMEQPRIVTWEWNTIPVGWSESSLLTMELTPLGPITRVAIRHHGWERLGAEQGPAMYENFKSGWAQHDDFDALKRYVETPAGVTA